MRVLVISDSCHSGTVTTLTTMNTRIPAKVINAFFGKPKAPPDRVQQATRQRHADEYRHAQDLAPEGERKPLHASVVLLGAAQDTEQARDANSVGRNSVYTAALFEVWTHERSQITTLPIFVERISKRIPKHLPPGWNQTPSYYPTGPRNPAFENAPPFTVP